MITKGYIDEIKRESNGKIRELIRSQNDRNRTVFMLENLGYLPENFDGSWLPELLEDNNKNIRLLATKAIGKLKDPSFIPLIKNMQVA